MGSMAEEAKSGAGSAEPKTDEEKVSPVRGITDVQFDGIGERTLEAWLKYWGDEEKFTKDGHSKEKAARDTKLIQAELDARENDADDRKLQKGADDKAKAEKKAAEGKEPTSAKS